MDFTTIVIVVIFFGLILFVLSKVSTKQSDSKEAIYIQRGALFTVAERSFYGVLEQAISQKYKIFGKVRVADVLKPISKMNKFDWQSAFNKISSKHFDYVLCQKDTLNVVAVVELDDKSHNSKKAINRDAFLEDVCDGANLKLIRFKAQQGYQIDSVRKHIIETLDSAQATVDLTYKGLIPHSTGLYSRNPTPPKLQCLQRFRAHNFFN
jgi:very-short-patch-repair endonuclease